MQHQQTMKLGKQQQEHQFEQQQPRLTTSIRSKAAHFVTDLTTVLLNPISDKPSSNHSPRTRDVNNEPRRNTQQYSTEEDVPVLEDGPDTSSFTAFLYSFLSPGRSEKESEYAGWNDNQSVAGNRNDASSVKENSGKKGLLSRGKQSIGKALTQAARFGGGYRFHASGKVNTDLKSDDGKETSSQFGNDEGSPVQTLSAPKLPNMSEPSQLMTEDTRTALYVALPALSQGKKWVLLYSTWRHVISLSTLYRRSSLCPGLTLLVVGDRKGVAFGGLVEAPLRPSTKKRYHGSNNTFVFTNLPGHPVIYRPTGVNHYFTLCSTEYLALRGGNHFALYLDSRVEHRAKPGPDQSNPIRTENRKHQITRTETGPMTIRVGSVLPRVKRSGPRFRVLDQFQCNELTRDRTDPDRGPKTPKT